MATASQHKTSLSFEEFCRVWQNAANVEEVASANGTEIQAVTSRAKKYREEFGIALKEFPPRQRGRRISQDEIEKVKAMVAKLNKAK